ncbi:MAG TPA: hypothetical protein VHG33_01985 [Woeseiaceae bacterium]|nr:hypothetical protein [Woeseiaceae bacterium]
MLIALRAILLALFIAAPFGQDRSEAGLQRIADEAVDDAVLSCPVSPGTPLNVVRWTAGKERGGVNPDRSGGNA